MSNFKHGLRDTPEYKAWAEMKQRCYNPKNCRFYRYGKLNIEVCNRWLNSFENFILDMGLKPSKKYSLDRIDNKKNYSPDNCKWSNSTEQLNNTSRNRYIIYKNEKKSISQWATFLKINYFTLRSRLDRGWDEILAIEKSIGKNYPIKK